MCRYRVFNNQDQSDSAQVSALEKNGKSENDKTLGGPAGASGWLAAEAIGEELRCRFGLYAGMQEGWRMKWQRVESFP